VRINRPLDLAVRDIEAAVQPRVSFLAIPKVAGAQHLELLAELVGELEQRRGLAAGGIRFLAIVETAAAFPALAEIARGPRVAALGIGGEDLALSLGVEPTAEALAMPMQHVVIAARAAGIMPLGLVGSLADFGDLEAYRAVARRSRALGLEGAMAIHPAQVNVLNEAFAPAEAEVARARALVAAARGASQSAFAVEGRMVDRPVIERAEALIRRADAIAAREGRAGS
jgi:citrate lyase subunit beta/citryl-CoA lyase